MMTRITATPEAMYEVRTARRWFRCDGHMIDAHHWIAPGDRYVASAFPPGSDIGNSGWWHARYCMHCCPFEHAEATR